jgi:predicted ester cyclase
MGRAREAVERLLMTYDEYDPAALVALYAPSARIRRPGAPELTPEEYGKYYGGFVQALPDFRHELSWVVEEGDRAAFESVVVGTFTGTLPTPGGPVPGNGSRIRFAEAGYLVVDADGRIVDDRSYADMSDFMAQIGLAPAPH